MPSQDIIDVGLVLPYMPPYLPAEADLFAEFSLQKYYDQGTVFTDFNDWLTDLSGTFTRSGTQNYYFDSSGLMVNGTADTPRFTYDPVSLAPYGLLYEPSAQNLVVYDREVASSAWGFSSVGITATTNGAIGPDGTMSAGLIVQDTSTGDHRMLYYSTAVTVTSASYYLYQLIVKPHGSQTKIGVLIDHLTSTQIDFSAKTATNGWQIEEWASGYFQIWVLATASATGISYINYQLLDGSGASSFTGDGTSGIEVGGVMLCAASADSIPGSYIRNPDGTQHTRSADDLTITVPADVTVATFTFGDGSYEVLTPATGAYSFPTNLPESTIKSFITVDLVDPVISVAGRTGNVTLSQADIGGLTTTDTPTFAGADFTSTGLTIAGSTLSVPAGAMFLWSYTATAAVLAGRGQVIGTFAASSATTFSNSLVMGPDAAQHTTVIQTSVILGDLPGASAGTISGAVLMGNEAGNSSGNITDSNVIGNASSCGGGTARSDVMGQLSFRYNRITDTVGIGWSVGQGLVSSLGQINQSVLLGSQAGSSLAGSTVANLILIGYDIQPPTATTSDYFSLGDAFLGDTSTGAYAMQQPGGGGASLAVAQLQPGDGTPVWTSGSGSPEGALTAVVGSLYTRTDGGAGTTLYVKESGSGNTGWVAK